jgi:hypothetical protein
MLNYQSFTLAVNIYKIIIIINQLTTQKTRFFFEKIASFPFLVVGFSILTCKTLYNLLPRIYFE